MAAVFGSELSCGKSFSAEDRSEVDVFVANSWLCAQKYARMSDRGESMDVLRWLQSAVDASSVVNVTGDAVADP